MQSLDVNLKGYLFLREKVAKYQYIAAEAAQPTLFLTHTLGSLEVMPGLHQRPFLDRGVI